MKAKLRVRLILIAVACVAVLAAAWAGGSYAIGAKSEKDCQLCGAPQAIEDSGLGIYDITNNVLQVLRLVPEGAQIDGDHISVFSGAFSGSIENGTARGLIRQAHRPDSESLSKLCDVCRQKLLDVAENDVVLMDLSSQKAYPICGNYNYTLKKYRITAQQEADGKTLLCITGQETGDGTPA